jgi:hypothetical protein
MINQRLISNSINVETYVNQLKQDMGMLGINKVVQLPNDPSPIDNKLRDLINKRNVN